MHETALSVTPLLTASRSFVAVMLHTQRELVIGWIDTGGREPAILSAITYYN
jgi:hypothetical protein